MGLPSTPEEINKRLEEYEKKFKGKQLELNPDNVKEILDQWKETKDKLEEQTTLREDYESKLRIIAEEKLEQKKKQLGAPDWIKTPSELKRFEESQEAKGGKGSLPLSREQKQKEGNYSEKKGFKNVPDMIDSLIVEGDTETLNKLKSKWTEDLQKNAEMQSDGKSVAVFKDPVKETGETITERYKRIATEKLRQKMKSIGESNDRK